MSLEALLLKGLEEARDQHVRGTFQRSTGSEFDFGRAVGFYAGLEMARTLLINILEDRAEAADNL